MTIYDPLSEALGILPPETPIDYDDYSKCIPMPYIPRVFSEEVRQAMSEAHKERVRLGLNNFLGGEISRKSNADRIDNGTHNWLGPESNRKRIENGTHNFLVSGFQSKVAKEAAKKLLEEGRFQTNIKYTCPHCGKIGNGNGMKRWHFDRCKEK